MLVVVAFVVLCVSAATAMRLPTPMRCASPVMGFFDDLKAGFDAGLRNSAQTPEQTTAAQEASENAAAAQVPPRDAELKNSAAKAYIARKKAAAQDAQWQEAQWQEAQVQEAQVQEAQAQEAREAQSGFGLAAPVEEVWAATAEAQQTDSGFGLAAPVEEVGMAPEVTDESNGGMSAAEAAMFERAVEEARAAKAAREASAPNAGVAGGVYDMFVETSSAAVTESADAQAAADAAARAAAARKEEKWQQTLSAAAADLPSGSPLSLGKAFAGEMLQNVKNIAEASQAALKEADAKREADRRSEAARGVGKRKGGALFGGNVKKLYQQLDAAIERDDFDQAAEIKRRIDELK